MPKCGNFIYITRRHGCSPVNLLHIFRTPFPKNISGWLLLVLLIHSGSIFISKFVYPKFKILSQFSLLAVTGLKICNVT